MRIAFAAVIALFLAATASPAGAQTVVGYRHLVLDGHPLKWGTPKFGTGARVTYALVEREAKFSEARNCSSITPMDDLLARSEVTRQIFIAELVEALHVWQNAANITFVPGDPASADILIGAQAEPVGFAFANVEYDRNASGEGPHTISRSVVCLNPERRWKVGFDGNLDIYDLRYTLIHELGHAIGLDHPAIDGQLMAYRYGEKFRVLQAGDIRGIERLYGAPRAVDTGAIPAPVRASGLN